jgi:hypothetical protein
VLGCSQNWYGFGVEIGSTFHEMSDDELDGNLLEAIDAVKAEAMAES